MNSRKFEKTAGKYLGVIGNPFRIRLLLAVGKSEACVCHLVSVLNKRQAFISQHLMTLRKAGVLATRREGKYVFYRLADLAVFDLLQSAGKLAGLESDQIPALAGQDSLSKCGCPNCQEESVSQTTVAASMDAGTT
jgi:ArsR family transcriptional regulator